MPKKETFDPYSVNFKAGLERGNLAGAAEITKLLLMQIDELHKTLMKDLKKLEKEDMKLNKK